MLTNPDDSGSWTGRLEGPRSWLTYGEFEQMRDHVEAFSEVMASQSNLSTWQVRFEGSDWEQANGRLVSGGFFQVLGVRPAIGRLFTPAEDRVETPYAVISHSYWQRRFGGRPEIVGTTMTIRKAALTVIGVTPRGFIGETHGQQPDFWLPLRMQPVLIPGRDRLRDTPPQKSMWLHVFGRLKPGVTNAQAEAQSNAIFQAGLESFYGAMASGEDRRVFLDQRLLIRPAARGASPTRSEFSTSLTALLAAVGVLLLIACANLANLLLARGAARKPEIGLRLSLGASRGRVMRQLITESLVLASMGAVAAFAVAYVLHPILVRMIAESDEDFSMTFALDPGVLAFVVATTVAAALLFGALPAWQATRTDPLASLKEQNRGAIGTRGQARSGRLLVGLQLALSLPLLVGAGLMARTVYNLRHADVGFAAERLLLVRVDLREPGYETPRRESVLRELVDEIGRVPGVRAASFSQLGLFSGGESSATIEVEGHTRKSDDDRDSAFDRVGPKYLSTLGVPVILGREFLESDRGDAPRVCVINEAFAQRYFERRNPLGFHVTLSNEDGGASYQVVGVARNIRMQGLRGAVEPRFYLPTSELSPTLLIRTATDAAAADGGRATDDSARGRGPAHHRREVDRGADGAIDGAGPQHRAAGRGVRMRGAPACGDRAVWRPVLRRRAAHGGDRSPYRAGRAPERCDHDDSPRDRRCRRGGPRARRRPRLRRIAPLAQPAVRRRAAGSRDARRGHRRAADRGPRRGLHAGPSGVEAGSCRRAARIVSAAK